MLLLPPALAALRAYRQFIIYQVQPSQTRPGKTDKFPIDWRTGRKHDAHDTAIWLGFDEAVVTAAAFGEGYGVGFVFTPNDPFWFIDVDDCLEPSGQWSSTAQALMGRFAGAAWEVSLSGRGLHGIGSGALGAGPPPPARKVKYAHYFDLYTENRFVALTGLNAIGDAATTHEPALAALVREYLTPDASTPTEWTKAPCDTWRGPTDDTDLIARALRSQSAAQAFGVRASFKDLWEANATVLGAAYPDAHRAYDASKADSALAQHLAFWTGKDCDRILRLMQQSALVREKWNREDYLPVTILGVVARQRDVLADKPPEASRIAVAPANAPQGVAVTGETFLTAAEQIQLFNGCVYICNQHRVLVPGGYLLKPDQFKVMFGGYSFPMDPQNERVVRSAWEAFTESQSYRSPRADSLCFRPDRPPGEIINDAGMTLANVWWPIQTPRAQGDVGPFLRHLAKLFPVGDDQKIILSYLAAIVQYPGRKFQWAPLLQGVKGNGKTLIITAVTRAVGDRYSHLPNAKDLGDSGTKFTAWLHAKLFIGIEEIYTAERREVLEALKPLITNTRVEIQGKGQDQITGDNRANFIACSNHKDAVPKTDDERRWAIFFAAQQDYPDLARDKMDGNYFPDLWDWFEGRNDYAGQPPGYACITEFLHTFTIADELNPATKCHRAPETSSTKEAIELSIGSVEQEVLEAVEQELPGFAGGWISSMAFDKLLARIKAERRVPPRRRNDLLKNLGYILHPNLPNGRVSNAVNPDGGRPRLFVKRGHPNNEIPNPHMVSRLYTEAQTKAQTAPANFGT